jgi:hypothetical protein
LTMGEVFLHFLKDKAVTCLGRQLIP